MYVSIDIASIILYYTIIPFASALALSIFTLYYFTLSKNKKFQNYNIETKIMQLENQIKNQLYKSNLIFEQFEVLYDRTTSMNEKLSDIQQLLKLLEGDIVSNNNKIKSQDRVISPFQNYVSNPKFEKSLSSHDIMSHGYSDSMKEEEEEDRQNSTVEYILKKLEDKSLTTREIQRVIGRTREHTSRLMKKLFEGKLVDRDMNTKPYRYTITVEGRKLLSKHSVLKSHSQPDLPNNVNSLNDLIGK